MPGDFHTVHTMLWFAVCLPSLPLEVFQRGIDVDAVRGRGASGSRPASGQRLPAGLQLAVADRLTILHANDNAVAFGVQRGMKRATALALAPELTLIERDPARERQALETIAGWALQFTPMVSLQSACPLPAVPASKPHGARPDRPCGLLLELEPSLKLFGGRQALITRLKLGLNDLGFSARIAIAPTPTAAWLMACHQDGLSALGEAQLNARLAGLPIELLDSVAGHQEQLQTIGARTLKDLLLLPRAGLARRFGKALLVELDRALGRQPEPRFAFEAPATFERRLELLAQVENAEALLFAARRLLVEMAGWLSARHGAVRAFALDAEHDDRPPTRLSIRLTDPSRDADRLTSLLREKLAVTHLPQPAHTLRLLCTEVVGQPMADGSLFPTQAWTRESIGRLLERLQTRLGREHVQRMLLAADHRPEAAYRFEIIDDLSHLERSANRAGTRTARVPPGSPPGSARTPGRAQTGAAGDDSTDRGTADPRLAGAMPRPIWLLPQPIALSERGNRPCWHSPLTLLAGPERIEGGWWDGRLVQRDYFIAEDESNRMFWIYRERLPQGSSRQGWYLQGRFG